MRLKKIVFIVSAANLLITAATLIIIIVIAMEKQLLPLSEEFVPLVAFIVGGGVSLLASYIN